jgi:hypothetical protein
MFLGTEGRFREEAERQGIPVMTVCSRKDLDETFCGYSQETVGVLNGGFAEGIIRILQFWIPLSDGERPGR